MKLLTTTHEQYPDRNIVIAPLPVSLTFAAILDGTTDSKSSEELRSAFGWENQWWYMDILGRMLLARFEKPKPPRRRPVPKNGLERLMYLRASKGKPAEVWLSQAFLYSGKDSLSQDFIDRVGDDFGIPFKAVDEKAAQSKVLAENWDRSLPMPKVTGGNDFWITSYTHLRADWSGNTFVYAKREKGDFHLRSGEVVKADFLKSEFEVYPYVRTDNFEAIELAAFPASILFVLPSEGADIGQLEATLADDPNLVEPMLARHEGDLQLPPFHFSYENDLRDSLQKMGVHRIFEDSRTLLSMAPKTGAALQGVAQKTEITVDENGIRADSGAIASGVLGGILSEQSAFHMNLNRPFLFLVRDNATHALLFAGAVMNPAIQ